MKILLNIYKDIELQISRCCCCCYLCVCDQSKKPESSRLSRTHEQRSHCLCINDAKPCSIPSNLIKMKGTNERIWWGNHSDWWRLMFSSFFVATNIRTMDFSGLVLFFRWKWNDKIKMEKRRGTWNESLYLSPHVYQYVPPHNAPKKNLQKQFFFKFFCFVFKYKLFRFYRYKLYRQIKLIRTLLSNEKLN